MKTAARLGSSTACNKKNIQCMTMEKKKTLAILAISSLLTATHDNSGTLEYNFHPQPSTRKPAGLPAREHVISHVRDANGRASFRQACVLYSFTCIDLPASLSASSLVVMMLSGPHWISFLKATFTQSSKVIGMVWTWPRIPGPLVGT